MSEKVGVSVICTAYNHEDYLEETLKSFVQQVTDFKFEVLAHDDASSDRTAEIIRKYEALYPDIIRGIYQTENQHSQNRRVSQDILAPLCRGKYVAFCPGDDRWIDSNKLQKQFDYMESHPECTICTHRAIWSDQETFKCHIFPDQRESRFYSVGDIIEGGRGIGGHHISWNSVFMRRDVFLSVPDELASMAIGDWQIFCTPLPAELSSACKISCRNIGSKRSRQRRESAICQALPKIIRRATAQTSTRRCGSL